MPTTPNYISLYNSGELEKRAGRLWRRLESCDICPRRCGVNRLEGETGFCNSRSRPIIASVCDHHGEEPVLSGSRGSGTIFFGNCNLRCVYCQNYQISQSPAKQKTNETDCRELADNMLRLQELGCHNINLVSPSHFVPQIIKSLCLAVPAGLRLPLVYNTNAYDSPATLGELDGVIDIYLPDIKYASDDNAVKYSSAPAYVKYARQAVKEMYRQVGKLVLGDDGIAVRGLIVRHLVLPNNIAGSRESLAWLAKEISPNVTISLMAQYKPMHRAMEYPELSRGITAGEYTEAIDALEEFGLEEGWAQELDACEHYLPDFERPGHPFEIKP